jgi:hypothetical protein
MDLDHAESNAGGSDKRFGDLFLRVPSGTDHRRLHDREKSRNMAPPCWSVVVQ